MSAKESTYEKVIIAADQLLADGVRPTQQLVRNQLGTGSLTTINKALNDWWQSLGERLQQQRQRPDIPEPVFDAANTLWQQSLAYAENQLSDQRSALEARYTELKHELDSRNNENRDDLKRLQDLSDRLLSENQRLLESQSEQQSRILVQEEREIRLQAENRDLSRQVRELELIVERLSNPTEPGPDQELVEYKHKNQYLEGECARLDKHNQILQQENRDLRDQLFEAERLAIKEKHQLESVISQQDLRHRELEQQMQSDANSDSDSALLETRLIEKERELSRLYELLKSFNKTI